MKRTLFILLIISYAIISTQHIFSVGITEQNFINYKPLIDEESLQKIKSLSDAIDALEMENKRETAPIKIELLQILKRILMEHLRDLFERCDTDLDYELAHCKVAMVIEKLDYETDERDESFRRHAMTDEFLKQIQIKLPDIYYEHIKTIIYEISEINCFMKKARNTGIDCCHGEKKNTIFSIF